MGTLYLLVEPSRLGTAKVRPASCQFVILSLLGYFLPRPAMQVTGI